MKCFASRYRLYMSLYYTRHEPLLKNYHVEELPIFHRQADITVSNIQTILPVSACATLSTAIACCFATPLYQDPNPFTYQMSYSCENLTHSFTPIPHLFDLHYP